MNRGISRGWTGGLLGLRQASPPSSSLNTCTTSAQFRWKRLEVKFPDQRATIVGLRGFPPAHRLTKSSWGVIAQKVLLLQGGSDGSRPGGSWQSREDRSGCCQGRSAGRNLIMIMPDCMVNCFSGIPGLPFGEKNSDQSYCGISADQVESSRDGYRSISRILSLPIFDDPFVAALRKLGLDRVEFWMVLTEEDSSSVSVEISDLLSVMTESDRDTVELILSKPELVDLLGQMVGRSRERIQAEIASILGFGMAALPTTTVRVGADDYTLWSCQSLWRCSQPRGQLAQGPDLRPGLCNRRRRPSGPSGVAADCR